MRLPRIFAAAARGAGTALRCSWSALRLLREAVLNLLALALLAALAAGLFSMASGPSMPGNSVVVLKIAGDIVDQKGRGGGRAALAGALRGRDPETLLRDVIDVFEIAAGDDAVQGVLLQLEDMGGAGLASLREIGTAMDRFRAKGKKITVWASGYSQKQYMIAAHASEIFLHPMGEVELKGIGASSLYWGEALRKLGVTVHVFKAGDYKSFPEAYVLSAPSKEALQADRHWMADAWGQMAEEIEGARGLLPGKVAAYIDGLPEELRRARGDIARVALAAGLVDGLRTSDEVLGMLVERQGGVKGKDELASVSHEDYLALHPDDGGDGKGVGVITIAGNITEGASDLQGGAGARDVARLIRKAKADKDVGALVVRINSPGGSAVGSELIRRELELVKAAGKPVVASMGDYAASGGYWIAAAADKIVADPRAVTGSIGVFGLAPTFEKTLEKLSVGAGGATTAWMADAKNPMHPMDPRLASIYELSVERTYRSFVELVAKARKLPVARVKELAQGKVYTGRQAVGMGLADTLGGALDAEAMARRLAGLPGDAPVIWFEQRPEGVRDWIGRLLARAAQAVAARVEEELVPAAVRQPASAAERLLGLAASPGKPLAHCLCTAQ
ncbi:MAG: signal peptide peptidase SppA [Duodenibacillus sp.]|nr:signal peptide peptidase SppA [Duodenibacillus sp.]